MEEQAQAGNGEFKVRNIFDNAIEPFNAYSAPKGQALGSVQIVAVEVLVSKMLRWLLKMEQRSVADLAIVHSVSQGLIGGMSGFFGDFKPLSKDVEVMDALMDGAKGIPGLFAAQYVVNTAAAGLHFPKFTLKDMMITGAAKAFSRPLIGVTWGYATMLNSNFQAHDAMIARQRGAARFQSKPE